MGALADRGYLQQWRDRRRDPLACFCYNAATAQVLFIFILQLHFLKLSCWNTLGFPGDPPPNCSLASVDWPSRTPAFTWTPLCPITHKSVGSFITQRPRGSSCASIPNEREAFGRWR